MNLTTARLEAMTNDLAERGFGVSDEFLTADEVASILRLEEFAEYRSTFKKAGVGNTESRVVIENVRGDFIHWIGRHSAKPALEVYIRRLDELRRYLNENLFLSLKDLELHLTVYPIGTFYRRHLDQFRNDDHRKLSVILYLNEGWTQHHGGQLRLYREGTHEDILPVSGRLLCFRSDQIEHEVLPATRERLSLTGWMLDRLSDTIYR